MQPLLTTMPVVILREAPKQSPFLLTNIGSDGWNPPPPLLFWSKKGPAFTLGHHLFQATEGSFSFCPSPVVFCQILLALGRQMYYESVLPMNKIQEQLSITHANLMIFVGREKMMTQEKILFNEMMTRSDVGYIWSQ